MNRQRKHGAVRVRRVLTCAGPLLLAVSPGAWAQTQTQAQGPEQQASWGLDLGARYTDNVGRTATDEQEETVGIAGVNFTFDVNRPRLDARAAADLRYQKYFDNTFDNDINGGLDGSLAFAFVPERFVWVIEDNYGQISRNRQVADNPDNRQDINYLSTGPDITLPFGRRTSMQLSGRYADAYFEEGDQDSTTTSGSLALIRQLSDATSVSINGTYSDVNFDEDELFVDYTVEQAFLRLSIIGARTQLTLDGGASQLEQDNSGSKSKSALARLDVNRLVGARSQVRLVAGTTPSNTQQTFRRDQEIGGVDVGPDGAVAVGDSFQSDYGYLTFSTDWERDAFTLLLSARSEDHEVFETQNRDQYRGIVSYSHDLTRNLTFDLRGTYLDEKFTETGFKFDQWGAGVGMRWDLTPRISLRVRVDHYDGSSDDGTRDYEENRAYLGIGYSSDRGGY
jgi:Putative beta-barrel porin 2